MQANTIRSDKRRIAVLLPICAVLFLAGCAHVPNQWREDGPATTESWDSPTARDVMANHSPAAERHRAWDAVDTAPADGKITHWPLYIEDPFVDKGAGREGLDTYHIGWEDYVALPYCYARYTLNWLAMPVSAVVTPPWTLMESDGVLSKQALGYDHDATRAGTNENAEQS